MPKVSILWGKTPEVGDKAVKYDFDTQAELDAFMLGVNEADGWAAFKEVDEGYVYAECKKCSDGGDQRELEEELCSGCAD